MLQQFVPNAYYESFLQVPILELKNRGIKLILCDIDNTLVAHDEPDPSEAVHLFVTRVLEAGLQLCFISNNRYARVERFTQAFPLKSYSFAKKPLRLTYRKILKDFGIPNAQIACIGDQLFTDVFGGNRNQMYTILTNPLVTKDLKSTKLNRRAEGLVFRWLEKKNHLKKGVYDE